MSIRQPYVEAILNGEKRIEYRSRPTKIKERVYIYASKTLEPDEVFADFGYESSKCPTGLIVGTVKILTCRQDAEGWYNWYLGDPQRLETFLKPSNQPQPGIWRPQFNNSKKKQEESNEMKTKMDESVKEAKAGPYNSTGIQIIDNMNQLLGDDLKQTIKSGTKLKIAASCFSIYAFEALREELTKIDSLEFLFTSPTFVPEKVSDNLKKERREFHLPRLAREKSFYGSEFEIALKNQLTQKAMAKECAQWIKAKASFKSNTTSSFMQQYICHDVEGSTQTYLQLKGFTSTDLGYRQGDAVSNIVTKTNDQNTSKTFLSLFDSIWNNDERCKDVTELIIEHISSVYKENSPELLYFFVLFNIFS